MFASLASFCALFLSINIKACKSECNGGCVTTYDKCIYSIDNEREWNLQKEDFAVCISRKDYCLEQCKKTRNIKRTLRSLEKFENDPTHKNVESTLCVKSCEDLLLPCLKGKESLPCIKSEYLTCVTKCEDKEAHSKKIKKLEKKLRRVANKIEKELAFF